MGKGTSSKEAPVWIGPISVWGSRPGVQPVHHAVGLDLPGVGHLPGRLHDPGQGGGEGRPFPGLLG